MAPAMDKIFNWILLGSLLLHLALGLLVMTVEPPPPPSQEHYATWVKKVTPPSLEEKVFEPEAKPVPVAPKKKPEEILEEEPMPGAKPTPGARPKPGPRPSGPSRGGPAAGKATQAHRAGVRQQLSGAGLLAVVGVASDEGSLANVFESGAVVGKDLGAALSERGQVRVSGGTRIGRKGALGAGHGVDIGEVDAGRGASAGALGNKASTAPQAFVKSSEAVIKKGGIDEKGVRMALKRRERGIQQCYERALKSNAKLKGKVMLEWNIDESGRVVSISVLQNTLGDKNVGDCISDIISRIRFPGAERGLVPVRKTFVFESGA